MTSIKDGMKLINIGYGLVSGTKIGTSSHFWSSSEYHSTDAWNSDFSYDYGLGYGYGGAKNISNEVRPVLEF